MYIMVIVGDLSPYMSGLYVYRASFSKILSFQLHRGPLYTELAVYVVCTRHFCCGTTNCLGTFFGMKNGIWTADEDDNKTTTKKCNITKFCSVTFQCNINTRWFFRSSLLCSFNRGIVL